MSSDSIQPPPLKARLRRVAWQVALAATVVAGYRLLFDPWFHHYLVDGSKAETVARLRSVFLGLSAFLVIVSALGLWQALRVAKHGQWPLPGAFVFKETPIQRGGWLRLRLIGMVMTSLLALALAVYAAILGNRYFGH